MLARVLFLSDVGIRQPVPNAHDVTFRTGAACFRVNFAIRTAAAPGER